MSKKEQKFIIFTLSNSTFAMPLLPTSKIIGVENITKIPFENTVKGIIYHNGHIISIIDTGKILKIKSNGNQCLLFDYNDDHFGILIDEAKETVKVKRVLTDKKGKYIKIKKNKIYIIYPSKIMEIIDIYEN